MLNIKIFNRNNSEIPNQSLHILTLHPHVLLTFKQVLQQHSQHLKPILNSPKLENSLNQSEQSTDTNILQNGNTIAELEHDRE